MTEFRCLYNVESKKKPMYTQLISQFCNSTLSCVHLFPKILICKSNTIIKFGVVKKGQFVFRNFCESSFSFEQSLSSFARVLRYLVV